MRIALDATYSIGRNLSGVGVYSREILSRIPLLHSGPKYVFCYRPHRFLRSFREPLPSGARRSLLYKGLPAKPDLFHALNQRVDTGSYRRAIATFHDLFVITGEYSAPDFRRRFAEQARRAAERSDLIIAVSRFTAKQVEDILKVERSRIRVIYHGVTPPAWIASPPAREPLILFVGALQKRKNVLRLVQAFEQAASGWKLALVGSHGFGAEEILAAVEQSSRARDIELAGYVTADALERLYARASIFAFPSLDEGFGMPVLDAMARGVPVLASNRGAVAEIAGGAALEVDPYDVYAIARGLEKLTSDSAFRAALAESGHKRSASFSWDLAAAQTWEAYRELLPL